MYNVKFKNLKLAKADALKNAKANKTRYFVACSSGFSIVQDYRLFETAGYYVADPDGSFKWDAGAGIVI